MGSADLTATQTNSKYLGVASIASGNSGVNGTVCSTPTTGAGTVGPFIPDHFNVTVTQGCAAGAYTYSGQSFGVRIEAMNGAAAPERTANYDGSANTSPKFAKATKLSFAPAVAGTLAIEDVAPGAFVGGIANVTEAFTFTTPLTAPATITLAARDADGVSSATGTQGSTLVRTGRLLLPNAFGSNNASLAVPIRAQYWNGQSWVTNSDDSCTAIASGTIALSGYANAKGVSTSGWSTAASGSVTLVGGRGNITLSKPQPTSNGSVNLAINLGTSNTDSSCLSSHPPTTPSATSLIHLRSKYGSCTTGFTADPSMTANFGVYTPESQRNVYSRERF